MNPTNNQPFPRVESALDASPRLAPFICEIARAVPALKLRLKSNPTRPIRPNSKGLARDPIMCQALAVWSYGPGGVGLETQLERGHGSCDFADERRKTRRCVEGRFNARERLVVRRVHRRPSAARLGAAPAA